MSLLMTYIRKSESSDGVSNDPSVAGHSKNSWNSWMRNCRKRADIHESLVRIFLDVDVEIRRSLGFLWSADEDSMIVSLFRISGFRLDDLSRIFRQLFSLGCSRRDEDALSFSPLRHAIKSVCFLSKPAHLIGLVLISGWRLGNFQVVVRTWSVSQRSM